MQLQHRGWLSKKRAASDPGPDTADPLLALLSELEADARGSRTPEDVDMDIDDERERVAARDVDQVMADADGEEERWC